MKGNTKKRGGLLLTICAVVVTSALVLAGCDNGGGGGDDANKVKTPTADPAGGTMADPTEVTSGVQITLTCGTTGATIRYTTDGTVPTSTTGTVYSDTNKPAINGTSIITLKAIAVKDDMTDSDVLTAAYKVSNSQAPVTISGVTNSNIAEKLAELPSNSISDTPHTVVFDAGVTIDTEDTDPNGVWATINSLVQSAQKYVFLDLSACTAVGNTINGYLEASANTANKMNIIQNNQYIKGIILPNSVTTIGRTAFARCTSLTSVTIPDSVTTIELGAFSGCTRLTSVTIPQGVTTIGQSAFSGCTRLTSVTIPGSVTTFGDYAFSDCSSLTGITVDTSNANYSSQDGVLFNKNKTTLIKYPQGKNGSYSIPGSVTTIGTQAFVYCTSLNSITIPGSVITSGDSAFYNCTSLNSITIPSSVITIEQSAFDGCTGLTSVTIQQGINTIGDFAFGGCTSLTSVTIPDSVTTIGGGAFAGCTSLTSVTFAENSNITEANFSYGSFPEGTEGYGSSSLTTAYLAASPHSGTYTRAVGGDTWSKQ
jgi:hypothetical protein